MLKGYQPGNFIFLKNGELIKILEVHADQFKVQDSTGLTFDISSNQVLPIKITEPILKKFNFILRSEKKEMLHVLKIYHILINRTTHYIRGYIYTDKSIWVLNNITILYFHQMQNLFHLLEPSYDFVVQNNLDYSQ